MKIIALFVSEKSFFATKVNRTSQIFELTHLEMLKSIFDGAKADLWVIDSNNDFLKCQAIEALQMMGGRVKVLPTVKILSINTKKKRKEYLDAMLAEITE